MGQNRMPWCLRRKIGEEDCLREVFGTVRKTIRRRVRLGSCVAKLGDVGGLFLETLLPFEDTKSSLPLCLFQHRSAQRRCAVLEDLALQLDDICRELDAARKARMCSWDTTCIAVSSRD